MERNFDDTAASLSGRIAVTLKQLRILLVTLAVIVGLALAVVFSPVVQTWAGQRLLARYLDGEVMLGSCSAGPWRVELEELKIVRPGFSLTVPSLRARTSLWTAWREHKLVIEDLAAKGWTVDLRLPKPQATPAAAAKSSSASGPAATPPLPAAGLGRPALPMEISVQHAECEGDVILALRGSALTDAVHLTASGGGIAPGREGSFAVVATVRDPRIPEGTATLEGQLRIAREPIGGMARVELSGDLRTGAGPKYGVSAGVTKGTGPARYLVALTEGARRVVDATGEIPAETGRLRGRWSVDLRAGDPLANLLSPVAPIQAMAGEGRFDSDPAVEGLNVSGDLVAHLARVPEGASWLGGWPDLAVSAGFDAQVNQGSMRFDRLETTLAGAGASGRIRALQPFAVVFSSRELQPTNRAADLFDGALEAVALSWWPGLSAPWLAEAKANGSFVVAKPESGWVVRATPSARLAGVALRVGDRMVIGGLDATLAWSLEPSGGGWKLRLSPLTLSRGGRELGQFDGTLIRDQVNASQVQVDGHWKADLDALAATAPELRTLGLRGRTASGDVTGLVGASADVQVRLDATGHDPARTASGTVSIAFVEGGAFEADAGLSLAFGARKTDLTIAASRPEGIAGRRLELKVNAGTLHLDQAQLLAAPVAFVSGLPVANLLDLAAAAGASVKPDAHGPFWGDRTGHVTLAIDHCWIGAREISDLGGTIKLDVAALQIEGGHARIDGHTTNQVNGTIAFAPSDALPYQMRLGVGDSQVDGAEAFAPPKQDAEPVFHGRFAVTRSLAGEGAGFRDLLNRSREEFQLSSGGGYVRLLKSHVSQALPSAQGSRVVDTMADVGSAFGKLLGAKAVGSGVVRVPKQIEAVLDFDSASAEVAFDSLTISGAREADGSIRIASFELQGPEEHLVGGGRVAAGPAARLGERHLTADLKRAVRGRMAELAKAAGLLSGEQDPAGYQRLKAPFRVSGSLEHPDLSEWRAVLVEAATGKAPSEGKGS